ncbi:hypothetical protein [Chlorobium sp. N1]|uniref:hypothetical protein n=1 Tax=Chlorobium sp. N1 TaxID=2491138 RepID=UPI00103EB8AC|nr:hypothetical protein [Chlorobium sp. N1]TCD46984.1 hypothetical protein E0L29_10465 [Chlorobium sp. N1]
MNMREGHHERRDERLQSLVGKVAMEKLESILSKIKDDTATSGDCEHAVILQEIYALASNRLSVEMNESGHEQGRKVWVERTSESHYPHIRLHGGALEDDPIPIRLAPEE